MALPTLLLAEQSPPGTYLVSLSNPVPSGWHLTIQAWNGEQWYPIWYGEGNTLPQVVNFAGLVMYNVRAAWLIDEQCAYVGNATVTPPLPEPPDPQDEPDGLNEILDYTLN